MNFAREVSGLSNLDTSFCRGLCSLEKRDVFLTQKRNSVSRYQMDLCSKFFEGLDIGRKMYPRHPEISFNYLDMQALDCKSDPYSTKIRTVCFSRD